MSALLRITVVQTDPRLGRVAENLAAITDAILGAQGSLVVFPECALTGYGFESREEATASAEPADGPSMGKIAEACRRSDTHAVVGFVERDGQRIYNAAAVLGPRGMVGLYRKMHLPHLGLDRFVDPGDRGFEPVATPFGKLGLLICYDLSFPEAARVLKLRGAQVLVVPTNWPEAAYVSCEHSPFVRAQENHVAVVTCNRVGEERGFVFRGGSGIFDCAGRVLARAGRNAAEITADLDPGDSDENRVVIEEGRYELDRLGHRRPEWYGPVVDRPRP